MIDTIPKIAHSGILKVEDIQMPCHVLENGERILSIDGIMKILDMEIHDRRDDNADLSLLFKANLMPFISEYSALSMKAVIFRTSNGKIGYGLKAESLPIICSIYLEAQEAGILDPEQERIANRADILIHALAYVGTIALEREIRNEER